MNCIVMFALCSTMVSVALLVRPYALSLVMMCLWGHISPQILQKVMELHLNDLTLHSEGTLDLDSVKWVASLGSHGAHSQNVWRDLLSRLPKPKLPKLFEFRAPYKHSVLGFIEKSTHMLMPHELMASVYKNFPEMWRECFYPSKEVCMQFWSSVRNGAHFKAHPIRLVRDVSKYIPLRLHGDGTPASGIGKAWSKMVDVFSVSSMLVFGSSMLHNFMVWMVHQSLICSVAAHHTMNEFWRHLKWSLEALAIGRWPTHDVTGRRINSPQAGTVLMGGFCAYLWACVGDLVTGQRLWSCQTALQITHVRSALRVHPPTLGGTLGQMRCGLA